MSPDSSVPPSWADVDLPAVALRDPADPRQVINALLAHGRVATLKTLAKLTIDPAIGPRREAPRRLCRARVNVVAANGWHDFIAGYRGTASKT